MAGCPQALDGTHEMWFAAMETKRVDAPAAAALIVEISHDDVSFTEMVAELKAILVQDFGSKIDVVMTPVPSKDADKVYRIALGGQVFFDWVKPGPSDFQPRGGPPQVRKCPHIKWRKPINFAHLERTFGSHEPWMVDELKAAIAAQVAA